MEPRTATHDHSLISLIRELRDETTTLVRQEVALAKSEMSEKASRLTRNIVYIAIGALVAYAGALVLLLAVRDLVLVGLVKAGANLDIALWLSPLIVGGAAGAVGWAMISKGKKAISEEGVTPDKTMETLREEKEWLQHKFQRT